MVRLSFRALLLLVALIILCFALAVGVNAAAPAPGNASWRWGDALASPALNDALSGWGAAARDPEETLTAGPLPWDDTSEIIQISEEEYKELLDKRNVVVIDDPLTAVSPVTPSDANGLKAIMLSLIGNYDPVVIEYSYTSSQGYVSYLREIEPDYAWMISAAIFVVVLYSFFRILGVILKRE